MDLLISLIFSEIKLDGSSNAAAKTNNQSHSVFPPQATRETTCKGGQQTQSIH